MHNVWKLKKAFKLQEEEGGGGGGEEEAITIFNSDYNKTRQDIYYHNITSTIFWHAVSKKTLVEVCQINSITNQILYYNK